MRDKRRFLPLIWEEWIAPTASALFAWTGNDETFQNVVKFLEDLQQKADDEDEVITQKYRISKGQAGDEDGKVRRLEKMRQFLNHHQNDLNSRIYMIMYITIND